jgi:two-component system LytT family response regulator
VNDPPAQTARVVIVDDEPLARSNLRLLLQRYAGIQVLAECESGMDGLAMIQQLRPDLVFLDVQMPECDGFEVLERLGAEVPSAIIFVTAYDRYALKAFEAGALDYLLKPFSDERVDRALTRAFERIGRGRPNDEIPDRLVIKSLGQILFIRIADIDWIEAADYYACLHVGTRTHLLRRSLAELESDLERSSFCRIHRSAIVNLKRVCGLQVSDDGEHDVLLDTGVKLRLSRRYRKALESSLVLRDK